MAESECLVTEMVNHLRDYIIPTDFESRRQLGQRVSNLKEGDTDRIMTKINQLEHANLSEPEERNLAKLVLCLSTVEHDYMYGKYFAHPRDYIRKLVDRFPEEVTFDLYRGTSSDYSDNFKGAPFIWIGNKPYSSNKSEAEDFAMNAPVKGSAPGQRSLFILRGNKLAVNLTDVNVLREKEYRIKRGTKGVISNEWSDRYTRVHYFEVDVTGVVDNPDLTGTANTGHE